MQCTEVRLASLLSGGFTNMAVINPPERNLAKCTSVQWTLFIKHNLIFGLVWAS